jgi:hypothetical protein
MNRVLSWPHTPLFPGLLESLKATRRKTEVTARGMVRFDLPAGAVEMKFPNPQQQLPPGTEVYVWWKGGGFVCAPAAELDREERESRRLAERLAQARSRLATARRARQAVPAADVDVVRAVDTAPLLHLLR